MIGCVDDQWRELVDELGPSCLGERCGHADVLQVAVVAIQPEQQRSE